MQICYQGIDGNASLARLDPDNKAANKADGASRTFCHLLHYTGCTVPDALDLTAAQIDIPGRAIILGSATSRRHDMTRSVPVSDAFVALWTRYVISAALSKPALTSPARFGP